MTETAKKLLDDFESLAETERREVAVEILRRTALVDHEAPQEAELLWAADQVFLELEYREQQG
jgi:hypothetical protein